MIRQQTFDFATNYDRYDALADIVVSSSIAFSLHRHGIQCVHQLDEFAPSYVVPGVIGPRRAEILKADIERYRRWRKKNPGVPL